MISSSPWPNHSPAALDGRACPVQGRGSNLVPADLRRAFNHSLKRLEDLGIDVAGIDVRAGLAVPQADGEHLPAIRVNEGNLVIESVLLLQQGQNLPVEHLG